MGTGGSYLAGFHSVLQIISRQAGNLALLVPGCWRGRYADEGLEWASCAAWRSVRIGFWVGVALMGGSVSSHALNCGSIRWGFWVQPLVGP